jgi:hypothetical protein
MVKPHRSSLSLRRQAHWSSEHLLGDNPIDVENLSEAQYAELRELFYVDATTEYDARHLNSILRDQAQMFPDLVNAFVKIWAEDEANHYSGLRRLLSCVTTQTDAEIDEIMASRPFDFDPILHFVEDPFTLMVSFAYDERVTVQAYATDYALYDSLGPRAAAWVRRTNRDEAMHYRNAVSCVQALYPDRLGEVPGVVSQLLEHDLSRSPYRATFLLDHDDGGLYFTEERLRRCAQIVTRTLMNYKPLV